MRLIDRYLFRQSLGPTVMAILALTLVALVSEALSAIGMILSQRQSLVVFAKVVILAMPQVIVLTLPAATLIGALLAANRLSRDNEIAVCFASGMSRWRVIAPSLRLASIVGLASLTLSFWLQPLCFRAMRNTLQDARGDLMATLIRPGRFTHPAPGLTLYAQSVSNGGKLHNLFIDRRMPRGRETTLMAQEGRVRSEGGATLLILQQGENQELTENGALNLLSFDKYSLDLSTLIPPASPVRYKPSDRYLHELMFPDEHSTWDKANQNTLLAEAHARISTALYNPTFSLVALTAILAGGFSRMGYVWRVAVAATAAIGLRLLGFALQSLAGGLPALNVAQYIAPAAVCAICLVMLFKNARPGGPGVAAVVQQPG